MIKYKCIQILAVICIMYNLYKDYSLIGKDFWDFLGGEGVCEELIDVY